MQCKSASSKNLVYSAHGRIPSNLPAEAVRISLQSETHPAWIYANSTTTPQSTWQLMTKTSSTTHNAINRIICQNTTSHGSEREIAISLQGRRLQGASDRATLHNIITQAWKIEPLQNKHLSQHYIKGMGPVDGDPHTLDSTTAKRGGFLGPLYTA